MLFSVFISWYKYFSPLRILYLFIKSFVSPYVDVSSTFTDTSFNSSWIGECTVLFKVAILFRFISLSSKFVFFYEINNITFAC